LAFSNIYCGIGPIVEVLFACKWNNSKNLMGRIFWNEQAEKLMFESENQKQEKQVWSILAL
jgi:hypothetical protein